MRLTKVFCLHYALRLIVEADPSLSIYSYAICSIDASVWFSKIFARHIKTCLFQRCLVVSFAQSVLLRTLRLCPPPSPSWSLKIWTLYSRIRRSNFWILPKVWKDTEEKQTLLWKRKKEDRTALGELGLGNELLRTPRWVSDGILDGISERDDGAHVGDMRKDAFSAIQIIHD